MIKTAGHAVILGLLGVIALAGIIVVVALGHPVPDVLPWTASTAIGAIAGIAVPTATAGAPTPTTPQPAAPQNATQKALSAPESAETGPAGRVTPGMSPVQAKQAGGS